VTNLAARLCEHAAPGQILISARVYAGAEEIVSVQPVGELSLRGFSKPARVYDVAGLDAARTRA
jgi:adenylate cyclase